MYRDQIERVLELCQKYRVAFRTTPSNGKAAGEWLNKGEKLFEAESVVGGNQSYTDLPVSSVGRFHRSRFRQVELRLETFNSARSSHRTTPLI